MQALVSQPGGIYSGLDREIERLNEEYIELLKRSDNLCRQADLYRSVPGVGQLSAATLVAYLPELGQRNGKALTSLVGLAPWSRDSDKKRGKRPFEAVDPRCARCYIWLLCQ